MQPCQTPEPKGHGCGHSKASASGMSCLGNIYHRTRSKPCTLGASVSPSEHYHLLSFLRCTLLFPSSRSEAGGHCTACNILDSIERGE